MLSALVDSGLSSPSTLSFVGSLTSALVGFLALVNARLLRSLGARKMGLLGVGFLGGGAVLSGFCTESIGGLFVTSGAIMGIGTRFVDFFCWL